ncbi:MAG: hypothetical protein ACR2JO_07335 [Mycobacteriales bacterium]
MTAPMSPDQKLLAAIEGVQPAVYVRDGDGPFELGYTGAADGGVIFMRDHGASDEEIEVARQLWGMGAGSV